MKKCKYFPFLFVLICMLFGFVACKNGEQSSDSGEQAIVITLSESEISLEEYETVKIIATVLGTEEQVTWSSANETIATVQNGEISGVAVGTTTVTASIADKKATCSVTVIGTTNVPTITLSHEETSLRTGDELNVSAVVKFKNEPQDVAITWSSESEAVATVENGKITAVGVGETKIVATATYAGRTVRAEMTLTVHDDVEIDVNETLIVLKNDSMIDPDNVSFTLTTTAKINNQSYQGAFTYKVDDESVATVKDGVITAKKAGQTAVFVSIQANGKTYSQEIEVVVEKSQINFEDLVQFETYSGITENTLTTNMLELDLKGNVILENIVTVKGSNGEKKVEVTVQEDVVRIDGSQFGSTVYGDVEIFAETETHKIVFNNVKVVTKYIRTAEDFDNLTVYGNIDDNCDYDGYFELESDLNLLNHTYEEGGQIKTAPFWKVIRPVQEGKMNGTTGFKGVFDGKGYQIKFYDFGWVNASNYNNSCPSGDHNGLFGNVAAGAVIKNLGVDAGIHQMWDFVQYGVLAQCFAGTLENCSIYVHDQQGYQGNFGYLVNTGIAQAMPNAKITDCLLWIDAYQANSPYMVIDGVYQNGPEYMSSYIAYSYDARKAPAFENLIVVINESQLYDSATGEWTKRYAQPFRGYDLKDMGLEGITVCEYTENFNLDELPFKAENQKYWRTVQRAVLAPQANGTWGNAQSFTHLTMAGGINPLSDEVGLEWSDKWTN